MASFVIDDAILARLTPDARRELFRAIREELGRAKASFADLEWDPDGDESYPLAPDEAKSLVRGQTKVARELLRAICADAEGDVGRCDLATLMKATRARKFTSIANAIARITQRLRAVTGHQDAWLFNWRLEDWEWDEQAKTYLRGEYFITGPAIHSLRKAFGMER